VSDSDDFYVIDGDDRVIQVSDGLHESMGSSIGNSLWECLPRAEDVFGEAFDDARESGREVELTTFYAGAAIRLRVVPAGETLTVYPLRLTEVNLRTLGTLAESLRRIEEELGAQPPEPRDPPAPASLQALP
jgi:hypothetical protein